MCQNPQTIAVSNANPTSLLSNYHTWWLLERCISLKNDGHYHHDHQIELFHHHELTTPLPACWFIPNFVHTSYITHRGLLELSCAGKSIVYDHVVATSLNTNTFPSLWIDGNSNSAIHTYFYVHSTYCRRTCLR